MIGAFNEPQQKVLKLLVKSKPGLTMDEIAERLEFSRPGVRRHLAALERSGLVCRGEVLQTGGRPGQTYRLSAQGQELFPKQYSWFSAVMLEALSKQMGREGLRDFIRRLGEDAARAAASQVSGETLPEKAFQVAELMSQLAYQAEAVYTGKELPGAPPVIEASNCVYHALATRFPEVCEFDLALLSNLTGAQITHEQCIIRGAGKCRFRLKAKDE